MGTTARWWSALVACSLTWSAGSAGAQTWPSDDAWLVLRRDGVPIEDPVGDRMAHRDIVGDATFPAAYVAADADFLYFRVRIESGPFQSASNYRPFAWGAEIDTDAELSSYELLAMLDGGASPDELTLQANTTPTPALDADDPAEVTLATYSTGSHTRVVDADSTFGGDEDFFIDWAIDLADLVAAGVDLATPLRFVFGTSNAVDRLASEVASATSETLLPLLWSDPVRCDAGSCDDCAALCGGDCLRCAAPTPACDGTQCVECASGGDCPSVRPLCDRATSTCVGGAPCELDADCDDPRFPACQPDGSCAECSRTNDSLCSGATALCDVSAGECAAKCTADADCTGSGRPACGLDGRCAECSEANDSACSGIEACNPSAGTCAERCGDETTCEGGARPICKDDAVCVECLRNADCPDDAPVCDGITGTCVREADLPSDEDAGSAVDAGGGGSPAVDAGPDAGAPGPSGVGASFAGGGCGCRIAMARGGAAWALALYAVLGLFVLARRRSRRR